MPQLQIPPGYRERKEAERALLSRQLEEMERENSKRREKQADEELVAEAQRTVTALGWDKPGEEGLNNIFESLKIAAGSRGATFQGRVISRDDTLADVMRRIPAAELEEAGGAIKAGLDPAAIKAFGNIKDNLIWFLFGNITDDPLFRQPGGFAKVLRRYSQKWLDPEGEVMEPRVQQSQHKFQFHYLKQMFREVLSGGADNDTLSKRKALLIKSRRTWPNHTRITRTLCAK